MLEHSKLDSLGMRPSAFRHTTDEKLINLFKENHERLFIAADTEDNSKGTTFMVNFFDGNNHYTFRNTDAAIEWLLQKSRCYKKGIEVWFANFQYDMGNLFRTSQEFLSFNLAGSRFITGKIYQERVVFRDILNVIPGASVKKLGHLIGLEKIESNGDFNNEYYCQRDTEIVFWAKLVYQNALAKLGIELKNTAASIGFTALLKKFKPLQYNNFTDDDHDFLHKGYYGGRTEVFNTAKQNGEIYSYDIVSSYPYAMKVAILPNPYSKYYTKKPKINEREGMVDLIIKAPRDIPLPYLPLKHDKKLIFPIGEFRGTYTYYEIRRALSLGYEIKKIIRALEFSKNYNFTMSDFIDHLYKRRQQAKDEKEIVMDYACKILMNGSYGKFALGNEKTELVPMEVALSMKGDFSSEVFPNNQVIVKKTTKFAVSTNYYYAAIITAIGRDRLYDHLLEGMKNGRTLIYCDTDSVFFRGPSFDNNYCGKNLGDLEPQYEITAAQFILPKTYFVRFKDGKEIYKCKGVKGDLAKEFFTKGFAESMQPLKYVETCRKNFFINNRNKKNKTKEAFLPFNLWVKKPKSLKSKYDKRVRSKRGTTKPIELNYDLETDNYI